MLRIGSLRWSPGGLRSRIFGFYLTYTQAQNSVDVAPANTPPMPKSGIEDRRVIVFLLLEVIVLILLFRGSVLNI